MEERTKYTKELLQKAALVSQSISDVVRWLKIPLNNGNHRYIARKLKKHKIDTSHFKGRGWAKGQNIHTNEAIHRQRSTTRRPDDEVFCENSPEHSGPRLRKRLIELGREYSCQICKLKKWMEKKITLHVDHINGVSDDNRIKNLRFLCPNCHQQTETWGRSNYKPE